MATRNNSKSSLGIKYVAGVDSQGDNTYRTFSYSNVNPDVSDDDILSVGNKIGALQTQTVAAVVRTDTANLTE